MRIKKVLLPIDTSVLSEQAVPTAGALAQSLDAELRLVLVHEPHAAAGYPDAPWNAARIGMERTYIDSVAHQLARDYGIRVSTRHPVGAPVMEVARTARRWGADLVVLTTHGRVGLPRAWFGSMADSMMRTLDTPVLMLRDRPSPTNGHIVAPHRFGRILVPLDGSPRAERIVDAAMAIGSTGATHILARAVAPVRVMTGFVDPYASVPIAIDPDATEAAVENARAYVNATARRLARRGLAVEAKVVGVSDDPAALLLSVARERRVDAIAIASRGRDSARLVFGSVTDGLLRDSAFPLLVCRDAQLDPDARQVPFQPALDEDARGAEVAQQESLIGRLA